MVHIRHRVRILFHLLAPLIGERHLSLIVDVEGVVDVFVYLLIRIDTSDPDRWDHPFMLLLYHVALSGVNG